MNLLYRAIGRKLSLSDGLRSAALPSSLGLDAAIQVAQAANEARGATQEEPYALLVDVSGAYAHSSSPYVIGLRQTVKYRLGNRLFIVLDNSKGLSSLDKSVHVLMGPSYPDNSEPPLDLPSISEEATSALLADQEIDPSNENLSFLSQPLRGAITLLRDLHRSHNASSTADWNVQWFKHVNEGLSNLSSLLGSEKISNPGMSLESFFSAFTYACFGLPKPDSGIEYKKKPLGVANEYESALSNYWSDENQISITLEHLKRKHKLDAPHAAAGLPWKGFDRSVSSRDSTLLAFLEIASEELSAIKLFAAFPEDDFFNPLPKESNGELTIFAVDGDLPLRVPIVGQANRLHYLRLIDHEMSSSGNILASSPSIRVRIPTLQPITPSEIENTKVSLKSGSSSNSKFTGQLRVIDGSLEFQGSFVFDLGKPPMKSLGKQVNLSLQMDKQDSLIGKIDERASTGLVLIPDLSSGLFVAEVKPSNKISKLKHVGPDSYGDEEEFYSHEVTNPGKPHILFGWGSEARIEGMPRDSVDGTESLYAIKAPITSTIEVEFLEATYRIDTPTVSEFIESPIHAAAKKALLTNDAPHPQNSNSLFGRLDSALGELLSSGVWEESLMHLVLPTAGEFAFNEIEAWNKSAPVITTSTTMAQWEAASNFEVDSDFSSSKEVAEFRKAFKALGVLESLFERSPKGDHPDWTSRTSWAHLWVSKRAELDQYLDAYSAMVTAAQATQDPDTIFWSAYPFSASVWETEASGKCLSVILSPLHPLRLGWLSSTEWTLRQSDQSEALAGAIEGWNFPALGPAPTLNGATVAVPSDSGFGQVFLGWSIMSVASVSGYDSTHLPMKVAGIEAPGGGASGLNKSATSSALKDYRRVNPHVTTVTIDLASSIESPRLREIDDSILGTIASWADREKHEVPGGVRVWDSLNRGGAAPINDAAEVASDLSGIPLTWIRYKHENGKSKKCNIRFLQDSGLRIEIGGGGKIDPSNNMGVISPTPLRRFESFNGKATKAGQSESFPGLSKNSHLTSFSRALRTLEQSISGAPSIRTQIIKALLVDDSAEWTVSGESLVSPSGMSNLLRGHKTSQMLWEWRPPIFGSGEDFALEKRPFISVARIPNSFKGQISELLSKAQGFEANLARVDEVLGSLGSRGVGLSSLLSMGGTHASGALGFYLTLGLLDQVRIPDTDLFVMPLDACDSFLRILSGSDLPAEVSKRADLLVITLNSNAITLTPVEIKFYGLGADTETTATLPTGSDKRLGEAKEQAFETRKLLESISSRYQEVMNGTSIASKQLWMNALATLTEAAIKLEPKAIEETTRLNVNFASLISGDLGFNLGKPIVAFYQFNGLLDTDQLTHYEKVNSAEGDWGLISLNTGEAFSLVSTGKPAERWSELASWAINNRSEESIIPGMQADIVQEPSDSDGNQKEPGLEAEPKASESIGTEHSHEKPKDDLTSPSAKEQEWKTRFAKEDGVRITVGDALGTIGAKPIDFWPGNTELTQMNVGVVGDLGTGKTQFLRSMVSQIRHSAQRSQDNPVTFLIFDYKRDYKDEVFIKSVNGRVLSPDNGIPLNVLAIAGEYSKNKAYKRAMAFCDVLDKIYAAVGPVQKNQLTISIVELFEGSAEHRAPTLSEVAAAYKAAIGKEDSVTAILNKFVLPGVFIEDQAKLETFKDLMEDRVVVVSLNEFGADAETKNALVVLMLDLYYEYMLSSNKWPFVGENPQIRKINSFLLVDEATNIMQYDFPVLKSLLLEGREWGFGTILASQYLSHFKTSNNNYGEPLKTWVIHKVPSVKQQELVTLGLAQATEQTVATISKLKVHEAVYDSLHFESSKIQGLPFYKL